MTKLSKFNVQCRVLVPIDVVDGEGVSVGDLGGDLEPLGEVEEGEELSIGDRIEKE